MSAQWFSAQARAKPPINCVKTRGPQLARADVIQKEKRLRAQHGDVVDAMIDKILADGVVAVHGEGDFELGAHAVGAGDQDGLAEFFGVEGEQSAEAADFAQHLAAVGGGEQLGQGGFDPVAQVNIDARRRRKLSVSCKRDVKGKMQNAK